MSQSNSAAFDQRQVISRLSQKIHGMERSAVHARKRQNTRESISTGVGALDQLSPNGGVLPGALWEWLATSDGSGAATIAVAAAARISGHVDESRRATPVHGRHELTETTAQTCPGTVVIVDRHHDVYPPALSMWGVDLEHTVIIQPDDARQALWALEQSLRCRGVAVTIGWLDQVGDHAYRRLQLATQQGGGVGMLVRSVRYRRAVSWADARFLVRPVRIRSSEREQASEENHSHPGTRRLRIELVSHKGHVAADRASLRQADLADTPFTEVDVDDHTGAVRDVPQLASATRAG